MTETPRLNCRDLTIAIGNRMLLEQVSLQVAAGDVVALLGPNGVGKTTLLHTLVKLLPVRTGVIELSGSTLGSMTRQHVAQQIALMPQHEPRAEGLSVREMVSLGRVPHRGWYQPLTSEDRRAVDDAILALGLSSIADQSLASISGGEWRRAVLARALAQNAKILLLDEPTAGLDLRFQIECLKKVRELAKARNMAVLVSLHDLNQAAQVADRIALLACGRLVGVGSPLEILTPDRIREAFGVEVTIVRDDDSGQTFYLPRG